MESPKRTARLAGLAYLMMGIGTFFGFLCAPLVLRNPADLAPLINASEPRFRIGIASDLLANVLCVLLVLLLYKLLASVDRFQAALMAVLLLVATPMSFAISVVDVAARMLWTGGEPLFALAQPQRDALAMTLVQVHFQGVYMIEIFWGLWLLPFGLLVYRSRFLPRVLGIFLVVGGVAYIAHSLVSLLAPELRSGGYEMMTMAGRGLGELPIILWLLIVGVNADRWRAAAVPARPVLAA